MFTVAELTHTSNGTTHQVHSEAPISINTFVEIDGLKMQVTARGTSPAEAVANLHGAVDALTQAPKAAVLSVTEQVGALLAKGLECAVRKGDYKLVERLGKAAALVLSHAVQPGESDTIMTVLSQTEGSHWYDVTVETLACTCVDYYKRHQDGHEKYLCKHGLAVAMAARITA